MMTMNSNRHNSRHNNCYTTMTSLRHRAEQHHQQQPSNANAMWTIGGNHTVLKPTNSNSKGISVIKKNRSSSHYFGKKASLTTSISMLSRSSSTSNSTLRKNNYKQSPKLRELLQQDLRLLPSSTRSGSTPEQILLRKTSSSPGLSLIATRTAAVLQRQRQAQAKALQKEEDMIEEEGRMSQHYQHHDTMMTTQPSSSTPQQRQQQQRPSTNRRSSWCSSLYDEYSNDIETLLKSLQSTEFVGTIDPQYHSRYVSSSSHTRDTFRHTPLIPTYITTTTAHHHHHNGQQ